jgi:hypothetical protein
MPNQTLNKNQSRTLETRKRLLEAAEEVFVRNGYEGAQLAEIASAAGRSKGAKGLFMAISKPRKICSWRSLSIGRNRTLTASLREFKGWRTGGREWRNFASSMPN